MRGLKCFCIVLVLGVTAAAAEPFDPSWESLEEYRCPQWFRDAKLGIFISWNLHSLQGIDDWYARNMYIEGSRTYKHHLETYGHPSQFGFKDFIPMWKAERFDPDELVRRFKAAGARYIVPIATYHDNYDCWDSRHHRWNSVKTGPHKDIIGLWRAAALRHGLRFGVTTHLARSWSWLQVSHGADKQGPYKGVPYDGADPNYQDFYHPAHGDTSRTYPARAPLRWKQQWLARIKDLCEQHHPDLLYFDGGMPFPDDDGLFGRKAAAWYYNRNIEWHNGRLEAVLTVKKWPTGHGPFREGTCVRDMEKGLLEGIQQDPWQNDTTISSWFYQPGRKVRSVNSVVDMLIDIVSKNGNLLLNIPPRPDGTLDGAEIDFLERLGRWMRINGQGIYATRPWRTFGEGPTAVKAGHFGDGRLGLTARDVRFTRSRDGRVVYAFLMDWPGDGAEVAIESLGRADEPANIRSITMLGCDQALTWSRGTQALLVRMPRTRPCEHAYALKVEFETATAAVER